MDLVLRNVQTGKGLAIVIVLFRLCEFIAPSAILVDHDHGKSGRSAYYVACEHDINRSAVSDLMVHRVSGGFVLENLFRSYMSHLISSSSSFVCL
jgi:hypothetical protein